ncbi:MAG: sel1 repeat family protein [Nitrospina sp.]|nr:sel1 repeat family protein [Nitrospina sp.]
MNRKVSIFILISILLLWASPSIALVVEYQEAIDAYNREDYKTSYRLIRPLAKKGFAQAQYNLGVLYLKGKGVKANLIKAKKLFEFAAEQGVVKAQNKLALMHVKGIGVVKDFNKAIEWWNLAAAQGNGKAQTNLGWMYEMGKGVPKDSQKAVNWYQLASNQGIAIAQKKLNLLLDQTKKPLQENNTNSKDFKSFEEIKNLHSITASLRSELEQIKSEQANAIEATNQGKAKAKQEQLTGIIDNPSKLKAGRDSFRENKLDVDLFDTAINSLGRKEFTTALQLFTDLANRGMAEAQINLGMMFESGQGVLQNFDEAIKWYQLAASQGLIKAQEKLNLLVSKAAAAQVNFGLGVAFEKGQGVPQDIMEAIRWYQLAADQGLIKAQEKLNLLLNKKFSKTVVKNKIIRPTNQAITKAKEDNLARLMEKRILEEKNKLRVVLNKRKSDKNDIKKTSVSNSTQLLQRDINRNNSQRITSKGLFSTHLERWAQAWEKQNIELYLSFYSKIFKGSKEGYEDWKISRETALKRHTNISIQLKNIRIFQSKNTVEVNFIQIFKSDGYSDIGVKELIWEKNEIDWKIIKETWVPHKKTA